MKIQIQQFGDFLVSRPAGREAFLAFKAYSSPQTATETIELDFANILVLAPSWADEFLTGLKTEFKNPIVCLPSQNASVVETLRFLEIWPAV